MSENEAPDQSLRWRNAELRLEELERAVAAYIHEAQELTLRDVVICDHEADACWCNYNAALDNLLRVLRR